MPRKAAGDRRWPADSVERWPVSKLIPYARNARTHSEAQIAQIAASMREWGWTNPVLVAEDGTIIAGHGRVRTAQARGWPEVPVMAEHIHHARFADTDAGTLLRAHKPGCHRRKRGRFDQL